MTTQTTFRTVIAVNAHAFVVERQVINRLGHMNVTSRTVVPVTKGFPLYLVNGTALLVKASR